MKGERAISGEFYPAIEPREQGWLAVGALHRLYWEESGNPQGVPVVFLHGGPGAGCAGIHRRFFDPAHYRIILFDQRGAGRSTPYAEIAENTTWDLIADIEALRHHLGVERWLVFGGSWGSTLALAYGQTYPEHCLGFILRGVFLFRALEVEWFLNGMGTVFPEAARLFRDFIPEDERGDLLSAYRHRLNDPDPNIHMPAAQAWCRYEEGCSRLIPEPSESRGSLAMARIEAHFMAFNGFLAENQLLTGLQRLLDLPAIIVQGRYDMVCPTHTADALAQAWPKATFQIIPDAGHSAMESSLRTALVRATDRFRALTP